MTSPVDIRPDHLEIVQGILREHLPAGVKVWVFGSRANWTTKDSSDLDLALEGDSKLSHKVLGALKDDFENSSLPYTVDVVDLHRISDSFRQIVESQRVHLPLHREEVNHRSAGEPEKDWLYRPQFPEHWSRRPLYSMARWVNGLAFRNIQFSGTGMPVIKIAEIKNGISGQTKFTEQIFDESVRVREGDLLFSWSGQPDTSIDASWWRGPEGWLNQHTFRVTPQHDVEEAFFYCLLRYLRPNFVAIARNKQTTGLGHVTKQDLQEIEVALPPLPEQQAIAHVLGTLEDKVELNRRMNETLEAMARALFKSWFVDFDPVRAKMEGRWRPRESLPGLPADLYNLFPNRLVDSELGEIPEGWGVKSIEDVATRVAMGPFGSSIKVSTFVDCGIPIISGQHLKGTLLVDGDYRFITEYHAGKLAKANVQRGDIVFTHAGSIGQAALIPETSQYDRYVISQRQFYLRCDPSKISPLFIVQFFKTVEGQHQLLANTSSTGVPSIARPVTNLRSVRVCIPPQALWSRFHGLASGFYAASEKNTNENRSLAEQRDILLPKLVSGEVGVIKDS